MMSIATGTIVTDMEIGIGPPIMEIGGIEGGVQTEGAKKAVGTGQIMSEEGRPPATEVMNGTGKWV